MAECVRHAGYPRFTHGEVKAADDLWQVFTTESEAEVDNVLAQNMPASFVVDGVPVYYKSHMPEHQEAGFWLVSVQYAERTPGQPSPGTGGDAGTGAVIAFKTGGGTTKITQAIRLRSANSSIVGVNVQDHKNAIGWDGKQVQGVDVVTPVFHWTETHRLPASVAGSLDYQRMLEELTGKINDADFRKRKAQEVLLLGVNGASKDDNTWELSFEFASQRENDNVTVGDNEGIKKKGWDYLDIQYEHRLDLNWLAPRPIIVRVYQIYETADFSRLGIGTGGA